MHISFISIWYWSMSYYASRYLLFISQEIISMTTFKYGILKIIFTCCGIFTMFTWLMIVGIILYFGILDFWSLMFILYFKKCFFFISMILITIENVISEFNSFLLSFHIPVFFVAYHLFFCSLCLFFFIILYSILLTGRMSLEVSYWLQGFICF